MVVLHQPPETSVNYHKLDKILIDDFTMQSNVDTPELKTAQLSDIASQTSPPEGVQPQNHVIATERSQGSQTRN